MDRAADPRALNAAGDAGFAALLDGIYEHSPWVAERTGVAAAVRHPAQLKRALVETARRRRAATSASPCCAPTPSSRARR
jgi:2-oxo-4-hydroxy-4-carboxy--5-ureidoimidazoline (OHCU) decarboxylase